MKHAKGMSKPNSIAPCTNNFIKSLILMLFHLVEKFPVNGKFANFDADVFLNKTNNTINLYSTCVRMIAK